MQLIDALGRLDNQSNEVLQRIKSFRSSSSLAIKSTVASTLQYFKHPDEDSLDLLCQYLEDRKLCLHAISTLGSIEVPIETKNVHIVEKIMRFTSDEELEIRATAISSFAKLGPKFLTPDRVMSFLVSLMKASNNPAHTRFVQACVMEVSKNYPDFMAKWQLNYKNSKLTQSK